MAYLTEATKTLTAQLRLKGGAGVRTLTGNVTCSASTETICSWDPGGASRNVTLTAEETSDGLFHLFVNEADADEDLVILNDAAATVVTIPRGGSALVACSGTAWFDVPLYPGIELIVAPTATAIPVTKSGSFPITQNGAETNTLAIPTFLGQTLTIFVDTDTSGARVITSAQRINQAGNTIMTLTEVGDCIKLEAITIGGALRWQVVANDGVALS